MVRDFDHISKAVSFQVAINRASASLLSERAGFTELDEVCQQGVAQFITLAYKVFEHVAEQVKGDTFSTLIMSGDPGTGKTTCLESFKMFFDGTIVNTAQNGYQGGSFAGAASLSFDELSDE